MYTTLKLVLKIVKKILHAGVKRDLPFGTRRRIIIVNLAAVVAGMCSLTFAIANLINGYLILAGLDVFTMICGFSIPVFQSYGYRRYPPVIASVLFSLSCSISSYFYQNNTEYFLLLIICISVTIWDHPWLLIFIGLLNTGLFFLLKSGFLPASIAGVPLWDKNFVLVVCLLLYMLFLNYFKSMHSQQLVKISVQNEQLRAWNAHNNKIMSVVAHDVRSPIANFSSVLTLLKQGILTQQEFDSMIDQLSRQVNNLEVSITGLLDWSKNQINNVSSKKEVINVLSLLQNIELFLEYQLKAKQIKLDSTALEPLLLYADKDQLEIVLRNLVSNAIKFSYANSTISIRSAKVKEMAHIFVVDRGVGIELGKLRRIFISTDVVSTAGTQNETGTGLGLKLAKEFSRRNGGDLRIKSKLQVGTTCELIVPMSLQDQSLF